MWLIWKWGRYSKNAIGSILWDTIMLAFGRIRRAILRPFMADMVPIRQAINGASIIV